MARTFRLLRFTWIWRSLRAQPNQHPNAAWPQLSKTYVTHQELGYQKKFLFTATLSMGGIAVTANQHLTRVQLEKQQSALLHVEEFLNTKIECLKKSIEDLKKSPARADEGVVGEVGKKKASSEGGAVVL